MKYLLAAVSLVTCIIDVISTWDQMSEYNTTSSSEMITKNGMESTNTSRISALKCDEYLANLTYAIRLSTIILPTPVEIGTKCHLIGVTERPLIVSGGGMKAEAREFVHMAAVGWDKADEQLNETNKTYDFLCGGSLISERFVLTAAHCKLNGFREKPIVVRLGALNIYRWHSFLSPFEDYFIEEFISHDQFDRRTMINDIAIIKLNRDVTFNNFIRPACLQQDNNLKNPVIATGWGETETGFPSEDMFKVKLNVVSNDFCKSKFNSRRRPIVDSQICAGDHPYRDTCSGDSGGPIQVFHPFHFCVAMVVGVTSYGASVCGSGLPGLYTRVTSYLDWIEDKVWL